MYTVYEKLSEERRQFLANIKAVHDYDHYWGTYTPHRPPLTDGQKSQVPPVAHPALRTHPYSGRQALYLCQHVVSHFESMEYDESQKIIEEVVRFATQPQFVYTHEWCSGDVVFWDNRALLHRATDFNEDIHFRRMHRTTLKGDRPYFVPDN